MVAVLLISLAAACTGPVRDAGRMPVGVTTVSFIDPTTQKPLTVEVWYPATNTTLEMTQRYGPSYLGLAGRDAPMTATGRFPMVITSHALRGSRFDLSWLAEGLAADGFVVAGVDHPGSGADDFMESESGNLPSRAGQLSAVIDGLTRHGRFATHLDPNRLAVAGYSLGGSTSLVLAGAKPDPERFAHRFPAAGPLPKPGSKDRRVRAVVAIAPDAGAVFTAAGIRLVSVPTLVVSGSADHDAPEAGNAAFYAQNLPHASWHSIAAAGHDTFEPQCTLYARLWAPSCRADGWHVDRRAVHHDVLDTTRAFLRQHLN